MPTASDVPEPVEGRAAPDPSGPGKRSSVASAVAGGLAILVLSLFAVSALGLAGFFVFRAALVGFSEREVPRIIQGSRLAESTNQLIFEVERLAAADSDANRRIAFGAVGSQLRKIAELLETDELAQARQADALRVLEANLSELDALVAARIESLRRNEAFHGALLAYPETAVRLFGEIRRADGSGAATDAASAWLDKVVEIVSLAGEASAQTSLSQIGQAEASLRRAADELANLGARSGAESGKRIAAFEAEFRETLFGPEGMLALLKERSTISRQAAGKSNFARGLAGDFRTASAKMFNDFVAAAVENSQALSRTVNRTLAAFIAALFAASMAFVAVTLNFRRRLILRLVNLNAAILKQVAGAEAAPLAEAEGNDEISDMTRSFLFYADEVRKREAALRELATKDALTGISNRRHFLDLAGSELEKAERFGRPATMLMLDIDLFKSINDTYGHPVGDVVIYAVVGACRGRVRKFDLFGRIGGEEFAVLMPETDRATGVEVAERIREEVEGTVCAIGDLRLSCTVSIGVASASDHGYDIVELMKSADAALYRAKDSGRNRVRSDASLPDA